MFCILIVEVLAKNVKSLCRFKSSSCALLGYRRQYALAEEEEIIVLSLESYLFEGKIDLLINLFSSSDNAFYPFLKIEISEILYMESFSSTM